MTCDTVVGETPAFSATFAIVLINANEHTENRFANAFAMPIQFPLPLVWRDVIKLIETNKLQRRT
jgi:hypothetical protein